MTTPTAALRGRRSFRRGDIMSLMRTKSIERSIADTEEPEFRLRKSLSARSHRLRRRRRDRRRHLHAHRSRRPRGGGPAVVVSFVIAAIACALAAMCYAEFASTVPVSGSAYTFSYASLGELFAWIIGWDLILEMFLGASVVAQGGAPTSAFSSGSSASLPAAIGYGGTVDVMAIVLVLVLGALMTLGIRESMRVNLVLVGVKLFIVLFVIVAGIMFINPANYAPFVPDAAPREAATGSCSRCCSSSRLGAHGLRCRWHLRRRSSRLLRVHRVRRRRDDGGDEEPAARPPIGIIASLAICTLLYCAVAFVVTGMVRFDELDPAAALANAFAFHGQTWMATVISAGAVAGLTTVVLTLLIGATRIIFAMSRDGLLPQRLAKVHPTRRTPWLIRSSSPSSSHSWPGLTPVGVLEEMVNIGTLSAFVLVSVGVVVLRRTRPDLKRGFRVRGARCCRPVGARLRVPDAQPDGRDMAAVPHLAVIGFVIYFAYSRRHSRLGRTAICTSTPRSRRWSAATTPTS
jgi:APA family basic amino acid/polyamine antiporter